MEHKTIQPTMLKKLVFDLAMSPDYEIEQFWLAFKRSICNVLNDPRFLFSTKDIIQKHINDVSNELNSLQKECKYQTIMETIMAVMPIYGWVAIYTFDSSIINIYETNIKRCINIATNTPIVNIPNPTFDPLILAYINIVQSCLRKTCVHNSNPDYNTILHQLCFSLDNLFTYDVFMSERHNVLYDVTSSIIKFKMTPLLHYISTVISLESYVLKHFNVIVPPNVSYKKILNYIN